MCAPYLLIMCVQFFSPMAVLNIQGKGQAKHSSIYLTPSHFSALRGSPRITVGERGRTHALHGEMLYPTTPSAAPDASVGAPQIGSRLVYL